MTFELSTPETLLAAIYLAALGLLALWGLHRIEFLRRFGRRARSSAPRVRTDPGSAPELPFVTVQLPLYNERTVVSQLLRSCADLDWPRERLELQILDDSTDETCEHVDELARELGASGLDVSVLRRSQRSGYKAGALAAGLACAKGELIAVFDADFTPAPDFLRRMTGAFDDPTVGMVQARWEHRNRGASLLTRAQAVLLDGHFLIEHRVRHELGVFFNFNGTAGIWRKSAITASGSWQSDTLTEDLDLSYRAQLAGWRFVYASDVTCTAELPPDVAAFKVQQRRWARGSVQVARKLLPRLLAASEPPRVKLEACAHLGGNIGYPLVLLLAVLLPLVASWQQRAPWWLQLALFAACTASVLAFYDAGQRALGRSWRARIVEVPTAVALGIGLSVSQTRAVLGGLRRVTGVFERTPKRGDAPPQLRYASPLRGMPLGELALCAWLCLGAVHAATLGRWPSLPFLALFAAGFGWVGWLSLASWWTARSAGRIATPRTGTSGTGAGTHRAASWPPRADASGSRPGPSW